MCSTPFGIIGIHTLTSVTLIRFDERAQRLSASLEFTRPEESLERADLRCSTPFGIIGIHTQVFPSAPTHRFVLNAFRHHWNSHFRNVNQLRVNIRAQRLSASLEFTLVDRTNEI